MRHLQRTLTRLCLAATSILVAACASTPAPRTTLTAEELELAETRTSSPSLSSELIRSLDLAVPEWELVKPKKNIKIGEATIRESTAAAYDALVHLDPTVIKTDYDRAWVQYQIADALRFLNRNKDAIAAFNLFLNIPHTTIQDRLARNALHELGNNEQISFCKFSDGNVFENKATDIYPLTMSSRKIEGWVYVLLDVKADGSVEKVHIDRSSMRIFEQPVITWVKEQKVRLLKDEKNLNASCFLRTRFNFILQGNSTVAFPMSAFEEDVDFTFRSIGVARKVRQSARESAM